MKPKRNNSYFKAGPKKTRLGAIILKQNVHAVSLLLTFSLLSTSSTSTPAFLCDKAEMELLAI